MSNNVTGKMGKRPKQTFHKTNANTQIYWPSKKYQLETQGNTIYSLIRITKVKKIDSTKHRQGYRNYLV